ncbi:hypothetical protein, partial [Peribacillus simplex]
YGTIVAGSSTIYLIFLVISIERWRGIMMNKNTVSLLCLSTASIAGGMALKDIFDYSMIIGVGLAIVSLLAAGFSLGKNNSDN